ncbi:MAG: translocation/assembly module TamB domain-containing protein [Bacteroidota bacterium]
MTKKLIKVNYRKSFSKFLSGLLFYCALLFLIILFLLQISAVQTFLARQILGGLADKTDHKISLQKVKITWLDEVELKDLLIQDLQEDTLLYANALRVNYELLDLLREEQLKVQEIDADGIQMNLVKYDSAQALNLSIFVKSFAKEKDPNTASRLVFVEEIELSDFRLRLEDQHKVPDYSKLDFGHLEVEIPNIRLAQFSVISDTISGKLLEFSAIERRSGFEVTNWTTLFNFSQRSLSLDDLDLKTPESSLADSLVLFYNGYDDFSAFVDSVSFAMNLSATKVSQGDVKLLTGTQNLKSDLEVNGIFWGKVGDFNIEELNITIGKETFVEGGVSCFGLPDTKQAFILADITDAHFLPNDLSPYVGEFAANLEKVGRVDFVGSFAGFLNDFVAKGDFYSDKGSVYSDINLKIPSDASQMSYIGNLELNQLDIGSIIGSNKIQKVNLTASVNGKGITPENADFNLEATLLNSGINRYVYDSAYLNGHFEKNFFKSEIIVTDPNCQVIGNAELDLRDGREFTDVDVEVERFFADTLNLTAQPISLEGHLDVLLQNFDFDELAGDLQIDSGLLTIEDRKIPLDSIHLIAEIDADSSRHLSLRMPGAELLVDGKFKISDLIRDLPVLGQGFAEKLNLIDKADTSIVEAQVKGSYSDLSGQVSLQNINPYLDSLGVPLAISKNARAEFSYRKSKSTTLSLFFQSDSLNISDNRLYSPLLEVNVAANGGMRDILTGFIFKSKRQRLKGIPTTKALLLEGLWSNQTIELSTLIEQPSSASDIRLESKLELGRDSLTFKVLPSDISILSDEWKFNPTNEIVFKSHEVLIRNLELYDQSESVRLSGRISDKEESTINIFLEDLNMDKANLFTESKVAGFLNGNFSISQQGASDGFRYEGDFFLKNLKYDDVEIGDVSGSSAWDPSVGAVKSEMEVIRDEFKSIEVRGNYYPAAEEEQLDFDIAFDQADLILIRPFVEENFSNLRGTATGKLDLTGTISRPLLLGSMNINNGGGLAKYLNTFYSFDGEILLERDLIKIPEVRMVDRKGSNARLSGDVKHSSFQRFILDLKLSAENFEFLNTTSLDNNLYYGSAYGSGDIRVTGPTNDILIKANVRTEANTRLFIPVSESASASQEDFIQFVNFSDTTAQIVEEQSTGIKGLTLDFDMAVTPAAYCELIFDIKKGDIIRGRGRGNLKLSLNTDGEFSMFGPLEIADGEYNFTMSNLINKEFDVTQGSRIIWYGDPYDATLDLQATYLQRASFAELFSEDEQNESDLNNKVPVLAVLTMEGSMLSPTIGFDIKLQNEGDANSRIVEQLTRIAASEQEKQRQFISLLLLRRFSPFDSFSLGAGNGIGGSVSEILSNQVSYLVSQIDENLEIEVDLASLDEQAFNTFQLRFAYTLLDGRLRLTRGGNFGTNDQQQNISALNSIVGDWSVEYSLTSDGRLRAKVFQNTSNTLVNLTNTNLAQETGISLRFVHSFNDLRELLTNARNEGIRRKNEEEKSKSAGDSTSVSGSTFQ